MIKKRLLTYKGDREMGGMWEKDEVVRLLKGVPGTQYQLGAGIQIWYHLRVAVVCPKCPETM